MTGGTSTDPYTLLYQYGALAPFAVLLVYLYFQQRKEILGERERNDKQRAEMVAVLERGIPLLNEATKALEEAGDLFVRVTEKLSEATEVLRESEIRSRMRAEGGP